jgi:tetratricopeptide (TPR) repeat protein
MIEARKLTIEPALIEELFAAASQGIRSSVSQTLGVIVQLSHQRLAANPGDLEAIYVQAVASLLNRNPTKSLQILGNAPAALESGLGNRIAGYASLAENKVDDAHRYFERAVQLDPCQADCWTMLGRILECNHRDDQAMKCYERAILFDSSQTESALSLSRLQLKGKRVKDAIHTLRITLLRDQRSAKLNLALAKLLQRRAVAMGRQRKARASKRFREEALGCLRIANASAPSSQALINQGELERSLDLFDEAMVSFQRAVELEPNCPVAIQHLANANLDSGNVEIALQQFERAIEMNPQHGKTHFRYTRAKRFHADAKTKQYVSVLQSLVADQQLHFSQQIHANFALAKVLEDLGDYDQSWLHYDRANRLKPSHSQSLSAAHAKGRPVGIEPPLERIANDAIQLFTPEFFAERRGIGNPDPTPVFIVGMPRSGTTLTEQILSSHPLIAGAGELKLMEQMWREFVATSTQASPHSLSLLDSYNVREFSTIYLNHLNSFRTHELRVTDKMPTNFLHLGLIALLFPQATAIHCRRNPMDVLVSCYCQNLSAPFCDLDQLVHYYRNYRRLMDLWERVLPIKIHSVDYESLVEDPEPNSRALIEACGLEWEEQCLRFEHNERAVHTPSKWQVRQPLYSTSVEKWRRFEPQLQSIATQITSPKT